MCGICGFYGKQNITPAQLVEMNDTMIHRGPDDAGVEIYEAGGGMRVGLAHRRLSILDLSPLGHQPMHSRDGRLSVVFNGEIYNHGELREQLKGYPFTSHSDTEVILAAWLTWGPGCVERFNGMFAIALFDRRENSLYLIRDRIGKKPLYYQKTGEGILFASELKGIMKAPGFRGKIREELLNRYLTHQYLAPTDTIFENVFSLLPGSILKLQGSNETRVRYWDLLNVYEKQKETMTGNFEEAKEELKAKLERAVRLRMIADVPVGTFLSGGYDSSLITALAQAGSSRPIKTFSIGFMDPNHDEAVYARQISAYLGTDHTELYLGEEELFSMIEDLTDYYDEPFADSSQIPTMLVSRLAREQVTVALSGDGGDEFFCGYNNYQMLADMQKLDGLGTLTHRICSLEPVKKAGLMERLPGKVQVVANNRHPQYRVQPFGMLQSQRARSLLLSEQLDYPFPQEKRYGEENWQIRRMLLDMETYLPGDILVKVDRAGMKYSLENRCPILDKEVMEYSFCLPHSFKYEKGNKKRILKEVTYDYLPKELLDRPKRGFSVPLDKWLRGPLQKQLLDYSTRDYLRRQDIFDCDTIQRFLADYLAKGDKGAGTGENDSRMVWAFFVFQKWYDQYSRQVKIS